MFTQPELRRAFEAHALLTEVPEGTVLMEPGQYIKFIPIIVSGCIRVLRQSAEGDETFLYHLMPGETCALSLTCCSTNRPSEIRTIAEEDTKMWMIPVAFVEPWQEYKEWKSFIGLTYQMRFEKLLKVIDDIAFHQMDQRLWSYLLARAQARHTDTLHINHEEIAEELNIQREAATRLIRKLKDHGLIETGRNTIRLLSTVTSV